MSQKKRALLIGINEYKHEYVRNLRGCVNDVALMKDVLIERFQFPEENVRTLTNAEATAEAIHAAWEQLIADTQDNDIVVFHYSGHGSQIPDREGDEDDGKDETIVPHDSGSSMFGHRNTQIADDFIFGYVKRLNEKTEFVTLVFDSCHSGTVARDPIRIDNARWTEPDLPGEDLDEADPNFAKRMALMPPVFTDADAISALITCRSGSAPGAGFRGEEEAEEKTKSGWLPATNSYVLMAGCLDAELSREFRAPGLIPHGLLTYHLCKELRNAPEGVSYRTVFETAAAEVKRLNKKQTPQMEGARNRGLFGSADVPTMRYLGVRAVANGKVTIKGGAAHGVTAGSVYAIYAATVHELTAETTPLGFVTIERVAATSAEATINDGSADPDAIIGGCRAVEHAHKHGDLAIRVSVTDVTGDHDDELAAMRDRVFKSPLMVLAKEADATHRVYLLPQRTVSPGDVVEAAEYGSLAEPTWGVIGAGMHPPHALSEPHGDGVVFENLEKAARYHLAWEVGNPGQNNPLDGVLNVTFLRRAPGETEWQGAPEDGLMTFDEGDRLGIVVENVSDTQSVFLTILNFGMTQNILQIHPIVQGASEEVVPGRIIEIGIAEEDMIPASFPEAFQGDIGTDRIKLLLTSKPADFSAFVQEGWRDHEPRDPNASALEQLMEVALTGIDPNGWRFGARPQPKPVEQWLTQEYLFTIKR